MLKPSSFYRVVASFQTSPTLPLSHSPPLPLSPTPHSRYLFPELRLQSKSRATFKKPSSSGCWRLSLLKSCSRVVQFFLCNEAQLDNHRQVYSGSCSSIGSR